MSDIVISGYYGFKNAGDELILRAIIADLRFYKSGVEITVLSASPSVTSKEYGVAAAGRWNIFSLVKEISKCRMLLSGSGGLFQDTTGSLSLWYYLLIILLAKIFRKAVFVYAAGIGEVKYKFNAFLIKIIFNNVDFITVRTEQDKKLLESFGVRKEVTVTADPVFGLKLPLTAEKFGIKKPRVGIILRKTKKWKQDLKIFSELSETLVKNLKAEVILIPFHPSKDIKYLETIRNGAVLPVDVFFWQDTEKLLELLSQLDIIVSMRLHGLILAAKYEIPFVPIPRYAKIRNFLDTIGEPAGSNEVKPEEMYFRISDKINNKKSKNISAVIDDLQNKSKKTAELCISVLTRD